MQHRPLLQGGPQGAVQTILQVQLPVPADHVREEVAIERRVGRQHCMQVEHVLGGDELVQTHRARRYLCPLAPGPGMVRVGPPVPDLLEDHESSLDDQRRAGASPGAGQPPVPAAA